MRKTQALHLAVVLSLFVFAHQANAVPVAVVDGTGQLTGINGISLLGDTWNVQFRDTTAAAIFGTPYTFDFTNLLDSRAASNALDAAFNGPGGISSSLYTFQPQQVRGIDLGQTLGNIFTPYATDGFNQILTTIYQNQAGINDLIIDSLIAIPTLSFAVQPNAVYADWTNVSAVPIPAAAYLMGTGLIGLMGFSRKRTQIVTV